MADLAHVLAKFWTQETKHMHTFGGQFWALGAKIVFVWDLRLWFPFGGSGEKRLFLEEPVSKLRNKRTALVSKKWRFWGKNVAKRAKTSNKGLRFLKDRL